MSQVTTFKCDVCGNTETGVAGSFGWNAPQTWLRVNGLNPPITADTPLQHSQKQPDFCSWQCLAKYAANLASVEVLKA
jgi:hypothetical protein